MFKFRQGFQVSLIIHFSQDPLIKAPVTTAADNILKSSVRYSKATFHMKCQALFS